MATLDSSEPGWIQITIKVMGAATRSGWDQPGDNGSFRDDTSLKMIFAAFFVS
jgi:hypothetical protein